MIMILRIWINKIVVYFLVKESVFSGDINNECKKAVKKVDDLILVNK